MANASIDQNFVPTMLGLLNTDGQTITLIQVTPDHNLKVDDASTGSDLTPQTYALRDENNNPVLMAVSSVDGVTPVELYVNSDGELLVDSN